MAKIGEGDARWIVEDRPDGANVNNWHWVEKDIMPWVKKQAPLFFNDIELVNTPEASFKTTTTDMCDGECTVNNRKGKTIYIYDLELKIKWKGDLKDAEGNVTKSAKGVFHFPSVGMENDDDEHECEVTMEGGDMKMKDLARGSRKIVVAALGKLLNEIREGHKSLQKENEKTAVKKVIPPPTAAHAVDEKQAMELKEKFKQSIIEDTKSNQTKGTIKTTKWVCEDKFNCSPEDIFDALTNEGKVRAFTQAAATITAEAGKPFSLLGGTISGENVTMEAGKKIVQKWRYDNWPEGHFSRVTIDISNNDGRTELKLTHTEIPLEDKDGKSGVPARVEHEWQQTIFHRIKAMFGYGSSWL